MYVYSSYVCTPIRVQFDCFISAFRKTALLGLAIKAAFLLICCTGFYLKTAQAQGPGIQWDKTYNPFDDAGLGGADVVI